MQQPTSASVIAQATPGPDERGIIVQQEISQILALAAKLRTGLNDSQAPEKLLTEKYELIAEIEAGNSIAALTEGADIAYFAVKSMEWAATQCDVSIDTLLRLAIAKYSRRAAPGNPKDKEAEVAACVRVLEEAP